MYEYSLLLFQTVTICSDGFSSLHVCIYVCQGWRPRGDWGDVPPKMWGVGTAHASVPPMFWEVVLSDARESTNRVKSRVKKGVIKEFFSEIVVIYDI